MISPLPEPEKASFADQIRSGASNLWQNLKRIIPTPFGQKTLSPLGDPKPSPYTNSQGDQVTDLPGNKQRIIFNQGSSPTPMPSASPVPSPSPTPMSSANPTIPPSPFMNIIQKYWPADQINNASNVQFKESSHVPNVININKLGQKMQVNGPDELKNILDKYPNTDVGLWQINNIHQSKNLSKAGFTIYDMLDPDKANQFASWLYSIKGYEPWYAADALGLTSRSKKK